MQATRAGDKADRLGDRVRILLVLGHWVKLLRILVTKLVK